MIFHFLFDFDVIVDKNMCYSIIYLTDSRNIFFNLLFGIQAVFRIYDNNLSSIKIVKSAALKLVS